MIDALAQARARAEKAGAQQARRPDRGVGFAKFEAPGQFIQGEVTALWTAGDHDVVTVKLVDATTPVYTKDGDGDTPVAVAVEPGDLVNVGLGAADLAGRVPKEAAGAMLTVIFEREKPLKGGKKMKVYSVLV